MGARLAARPLHDFVTAPIVAVKGMKCGRGTYCEVSDVARLESAMRNYLLALAFLALIAAVIGLGVATEHVTASTCFGPDC
jgi:hypothetical protein